MPRTEKSEEIRQDGREDARYRAIAEENGLDPEDTGEIIRWILDHADKDRPEMATEEDIPF